MATWKPRSDEPVGSNEHIGRRLFAEPMLAGAQVQKPWAGIDLRHFEEKRDREFSLDRLGRTSVDKGVLRYVQPKAVATGEKFRPPKPFSGWAVIRAKLLADPPVGGYKLPVIASPITDPDDEENHYHAHVNLPPEQTSYFNALHLRNLFVTCGSITPAEKGAAPASRSLRTWAALGIWNRMVGCAARFRRESGPR